MKRLIWAIVAVVLVLVPLAVAAPAQSTAQSTVQSSVQSSVQSPTPSASRSSAFPWKAVIVFDKNWHNQFDSLVKWDLYERQAGAWKLVEAKAWRAGSGLPGRVGRDSCAVSQGWLPDGTYRVRQSDDYDGNVIKGRVFRLDDKACGHGRVRHNLFLHTETGPGNHQCADRPGDQPCRWEWPEINDYKSLGCIKMAPADIAELVALYHRHFRAGVRYPADRVSLKVVS